ncbi:Oidioi.mRNA.OKI2018_I69.PAR.g13121.t1.cds [Oikopleura dioica]|uniref:Oidioi.mRNA.OKI2018_I69.PAR.g13121.t1.cds n=1 Tax=Oikopleura dioica TaxID=34765 RepID=A0ABN7S366_OIKDI|nr:Oidioi.mRNA.OKI2018_I69.PAR.g13121.t1.cds [Oikopleura dioica]
MKDGVLCGGALVSPNWVLTSADCAKRFEEKWGSVFLERIEDGVLLGPSREQCVVKIVVHPNYTVESRESNVALLKLNTDRAHFAGLTSSICIPEKPAERNLGQLHMLRNCVVTSWMESEPDSSTQLSPKHRPVQIHRRPRCGAFNSEGLICSSGKGFGVCKGTNGAVLSCEDINGKWSAYGIGGLVMDNDCTQGSQVSEYTDISRHADWIKETIREEQIVPTREVYSNWENWSTCTEVCNGGTQMRRRRCLARSYCSMHEVETRPCSTFPCETLFGLGPIGFRRQIVEEKPKEGASVCFHDYVQERTMRVVGGQATDAESWPFMAVFYSKKGGWGSRFCGGSLLNERWVLSAAHCFMDPYSGEMFNFKKYAVGFGNFKSGTFPGQTSSVKSIKCHKGFKATYEKITDDICLVELNDPVQYTKTVNPVCISKNQPAEGDYCKIAGAGQTLGTASDATLNEASIPVANFDQCNQEYKDFGITLESRQHLCAGFDKGPSCSEDIDECSTSPCDYDQKCVNTVGSYRCEDLSCQNGYEAVNGECVDIDECAMNACGYTMCVNLPGSFECVCQDGYEVVNGRCLDINECERDSSLCGDGKVCKNRLGGYFCEEIIENEEKNSWTYRCDPPRELQRSKYVCAGDECTLQCDSGSSMSKCINNGSRKCTCMGSRCFWSSIGKECQCKEDEISDYGGFMLGPMSDTGGWSEYHPQFIDNRAEEEPTCNYNLIKKKCKTKMRISEYLNGEICRGKCNKRGKSSSCTCNCIGNQCSWKCRKDKC